MAVLYLKKKTLAITVILALCIVKILLVSGNEILAKPWDSATYVALGEEWYWNVDQMPPRPPGYPIWISLVSCTGLPLRMGIEVLFLYSCFIFACASWRCGLHTAWAVAVFGVMVFHPYSFRFFDAALSGTFYGCIFILSIALVFLSFSPEKSSGATVFCRLFLGICFFILWNTREEYMLLIIFLVQIVFSLFLLEWIRGYGFVDTVRDFFVRYGPPICIFAILNATVLAANYFVFDYWGKGSVSPPHIGKVLIELTKIKTSSNVRYAIITKEARDIAYRNSPTFARLKPYLEKVSKSASAFTGIRKEINTSHFHFSLKSALQKVGAHTMNQKVSMCEKIASELEAARKRNEFESRFVFSPFIEPNLSWIRDLPEAVFEICSKFVGKFYSSFFESQVMPERFIDLFDKACNRRSALLKKGPLTGIVLIDEYYTLAKMELKIANNKNYHFGSTDTLSVVEHFSDCSKDTVNVAGKKLKKIAFEFPKVRDRCALSELSILLTIKDKDAFLIKPLRKGLNRYENEQAGGIFYIDIEGFPMPYNFFQRAAINVQISIGTYYGVVLEWGTGLALLVLCAFGFFRKDGIKRVQPEILLLSANIFLVIAARILLFSLISVNCWPASEPRYMFLSYVLYSALVIIVTGMMLDRKKNGSRLKP